MKVVLLNTSSRTGGAAVAAARLLRALRKQGVSVQMCVLHKRIGSKPLRKVVVVIFSIGFVFIGKELLSFYTTILTVRNCSGSR